jgi:SAM-dependent methyltransferase
MSFGQDYARSYDAFYRGKDYPAEARFVRERLARMLGTQPLRLLDLGCGTGVHDIELVRAGHDVTGADMSADMLARAAERRDGLPENLRDHVRFLQGDARTLRTGETYDAVISLFHVMSYMAGEGDFAAALDAARRHLQPGGAFLFDVWHGSAVLADPPQRREREIDEDGKKIRRITTPHWDRDRDTVRIVFDVEEDGRLTASEQHIMRYFFPDGLSRDLRAAGFEPLEIGEWLTGAPPHDKAFGIFAAARAL